MKTIFNRFLAVFLPLLMAMVPLRAAVVIETTNATTSLAFSGNILTNDLIDASQPTLASVVPPVSHPSFPPGGLNDGVGNASVPGGNVFFDTVRLPATATFNLDVSGNTNGYTLTSIRTICGWATVSQSQANQKYEVHVQTAGAAGYTLLTNVDYSPFPTTDGQYYESQVTISDDAGGVLATGVVSLQFVFQVPGISGGNFAGTVCREVDVTGYSSVTNPPPPIALSLSLPKTRQIVQRDALNRANLLLNGTVTGAVARLEARALVMPGATNNGVSTDWVVLADALTEGPFSGTISNLTAGGWYRIEVRAMDATTNVLATSSVERVGVGDLFVTAGQSNAGCFGSPPQTPGDDRVSAFTLTVSPAYSWQFAADPQPNISGFVGGNGSAWPILGSRLVASNQVPVGFIGLAYGATEVSQWLPGTSNYRNLTNTLVRLGAHGVRAVLWHQGESDSLATTPAATYAQRLSSIINASRAAAGWTVPWGIAEVSFHPSSVQGQEEPVAAGQRQCQYTVSDCFRGANTDDFSLENKLWDGVHFNAVGLVDHAQQWADAIQGVQDLTPKNGNFEANASLADGGSSYGTRVAGWNRLSSTGAALASGLNGYFNPGANTYSNAADTINGGVLANMDGKHVATLTAVATSNVFLQTLRARLQPSTLYTLNVALGVRDNGNVFGGYRFDFLANAAPLGQGVSGDVSTLNGLAGGSAAGKFTVVSCVVTSAVSVATNQQLAIRIMKLGGSGTYLDFDHVQVSSQLTGYGQFQMDNWGSLYDEDSLPEADSEGDGLPNLIESLVAGLSPAVVDPLPLPTLVSVSGEDYLQMSLPKKAPPLFGSVGLVMSHDLLNWFAPSNTTDVVVVDNDSEYRVQVRRSAIAESYFRIVARLP
jgi:hypothetical protein